MAAAEQNITFTYEGVDKKGAKVIATSNAITSRVAPLPRNARQEPSARPWRTSAAPTTPKSAPDAPAETTSWPRTDRGEPPTALAR